RKIAKAVGVTPMAIYCHYADKDEILDALMLDAFAAWEEKVRAIRARDPMKWLEKLAWAYLDFAIDEPRRFEAAFLLSGRQARKYPDDYLAGPSVVGEMMGKRIDQLKLEGKLAKAPTLEIALTLWALSQGLVSMYRAGRFVSEAEFRRIYSDACAHCIRGFVPDAKI
ncbi:MAG TPA: TetR/AcrR family transcriptional regulator, partial [Alphaproteobacteria bacterium]|nr:TetR/AcrR family transcriptional regulator [Alphaproteobacteria bacterium]